MRVLNVFINNYVQLLNKQLNRNRESNLNASSNKHFLDDNLTNKNKY